MKKVAILLIGLLLLMSIALADNGTHNSADNGKQDAVTTGANIVKQPRGNPDADNNESNKTGPVIEANGSQVHAGLYNALSKVENENARAALERNMERFLEKYQARLNNMTDVKVNVDEETGETKIKAKEQVKYFGFIKGKAKKRFEIQNNGQMTEKQPWFRFLYSEEKTE